MKQKTMEGKELLADAVRMLVAWQWSLTEEWSSKTPYSYTYSYTPVSLRGFDSRVCYYNLRRDIHVYAGEIRVYECVYEYGRL